VLVRGSSPAPRREQGPGLLIEGFLESVFLDLHHLDDLCLWAMHHVYAPPQLAQRSLNGLGLACRVELEVDHDVVGIVGRSDSGLLK
jgi:hypothetical protein